MHDACVTVLTSLCDHLNSASTYSMSHLILHTPCAISQYILFTYCVHAALQGSTGKLDPPFCVINAAGCALPRPGTNCVSAMNGITECEDFR